MLFKRKNSEFDRGRLRIGILSSASNGRIVRASLEIFWTESKKKCRRFLAHPIYQNLFKSCVLPTKAIVSVKSTKNVFVNCSQSSEVSNVLLSKLFELEKRVNF